MSCAWTSALADCLPLTIGQTYHRYVPGRSSTSLPPKRHCIGTASCASVVSRRRRSVVPRKSSNRYLDAVDTGAQANRRGVACNRRSLAFREVGLLDCPDDRWPLDRGGECVPASATEGWVGRGGGSETLAVTGSGEIAVATVEALSWFAVTTPSRPARSAEAASATRNMAPSRASSSRGRTRLPNGATCSMPWATRVVTGACLCVRARVSFGRGSDERALSASSGSTSTSSGLCGSYGAAAAVLEETALMDDSSAMSALISIAVRPGELTKRTPLPILRSPARGGGGTDNGGMRGMSSSIVVGAVRLRCACTHTTRMLGSTNRSRGCSE